VWRRQNQAQKLSTVLWQATAPESAATHPLNSSGVFFRTSSSLASPTKSTRQKPPTPRKNALGTLAAAVDKTIVLTGTLTGGMASDVFNILYRIDPARMVSQGYEYGDAGIRSFTETYGVLETITTIDPQENACSKAKVTKRSRSGLERLRYSSVDFSWILGHSSRWKTSLPIFRHTPRSDQCSDG